MRSGLHSMYFAVSLFVVAAIGFTPLSTARAADLLVLADDVPAGLDFDGPSASLIPTYTGIVNLLEPLIYFQERPGDSEGVRLLNFNAFEGRLAESWSFDAETLTWEFKLRRDVVGCDGNPFTADDVIYTYARAKSISGSAPIGWFLANVSSIANFTPAVFGDENARKLGDEVTKVDDYLVRIKQSGPNPLLEPVLTIFASQILDEEQMREHATGDDPWSHNYNNNENAPGFGPWCLDSWDKGAEFRVRANPNYYRGKPAYDKVIVRRVPASSNRTVILRTGQAHIAERLTPKEYDNLRKAKGVKVVGTYGNENLFLHLNFKTPPFDKPLIRQAIAHAIPYGSIVSTGYFGDAKKWNGVIPSTYPGYHRSKFQYSYNPARAKSLLGEAGFPDGKGLDAYAESFKLTYIAEREGVLGPVATILKTALNDVGIPVILDPIPSTQYGDRELVKRDLPLGLTDHVKPIGVDAAYGVILSYVSAAKGGILNSMNYSNEDVDNSFYAALNEGNQKKRDVLLAGIQDQLMKDLAVLPVVEPKTKWALSDRVTGVVWHPDNALHWYDFKPVE